MLPFIPLAVLALAPASASYGHKAAAIPMTLLLQPGDSLTNNGTLMQVQSATQVSLYDGDKLVTGPLRSSPPATVISDRYNHYYVPGWNTTILFCKANSGYRISQPYLDLQSGPTASVEIYNQSTGADPSCSTGLTTQATLGLPLILAIVTTHRIATVSHGCSVTISYNSPNVSVQEAYDPYELCYGLTFQDTTNSNYTSSSYLSPQSSGASPLTYSFTDTLGPGETANTHTPNVQWGHHHMRHHRHHHRHRR